MPVDPKSGKEAEEKDDPGVLANLQLAVEKLTAEVAQLAGRQQVTSAKVKRGEDLLERLFGKQKKPA